MNILGCATMAADVLAAMVVAYIAYVRLDEVVPDSGVNVVAAFVAGLLWPIVGPVIAARWLWQHLVSRETSAARDLAALLGIEEHEIEEPADALLPRPEETTDAHT